MDDWWKQALAAVGTFMMGGGLMKLWSDWRKSRTEDAKAAQDLDHAAGDWQMRSRQEEEKFILEVRKKLVAELKGELETVRRRLDSAENDHRQLRSDYGDLKDEHARCTEENAELKVRIKDLEDKSTGKEERVRSLEDEVRKLREEVRRKQGGAQSEVSP